MQTTGNGGGNTDWPRSAAVTGAAIAAAIAAVVIIGWTAGSEPLINLRNGFTPVQYNTALSFLGCSLALLAVVRRRTRMATLAAGASALLAVATGFEYAAAVDLHIDTVFFNQLVADNIPGRMAPNTVVAFLCIASALLSLAWRSRVPRAVDVAASLAAFVAAVGAVALTGYLARIPSAYQWGRERPIALLTTVAFMALAMGAIAAAWQGCEDDRRRLPRWLPAPMFVLLMSLCGMIAKALWDASRIAVMPQARRSLVFSMGLVLVFGATVSTAFGMVIRLAQAAHSRSRELEALNRALDAEGKRRQLFSAQLEGERRRFRDVLNALPAYVILLSPDYHVPFANRYFEERFGRAEGRRCYEYLFQRSEPCENCETFTVLKTAAPHHWEWLGPDSRHYDIDDFPFTDVDGSPLIMETGSDITDRKRAEAELKRLNRALRLVSACTQAIAHASTEDELLHNVCELAATTGGYRLAWVGFAAEDAAKTVCVAAKAGEASDYVSDEFVTWADEPRGRGPTGTAIRTGQTAGCDDIQTDASFQLWRDRALQFGFRSSLVIPLLRDGRAFGAFSLYAAEPHAFHDEERALFVQFVADLTFGIEAIRTRRARLAMEERYRSLIVATAQVIWTTDPNGLVRTDMPSWREFTGLTVEQLQGWGWLSSLHPDDRERTAQVWSDAVERRALYETEYRLRRHDGEYRHMWVRGVPVLEPEGTIREWVGTCTDITVRKQAEEQAQRASLYARSLLESSLDPLVTIGRDGRIMDVNRATEQVTGVAREQLIGSDFSDYFTEPDKAREGYQQVFAEGTVRDYPLAIRSTSGTETDVLYNATLYRDREGKVEGIFAAARDITARKRAEEQVLRASLYSRSLLEASLDPLVTIGRDGRIMDVNRATEQVTGVSREQLIGSDFSDYFTQPDKAREGYLRVFAAGTVRDYPHAIRSASGAVTDVIYNASLFKDENGCIAGIFAAARDITERKRAQQELERYAEELKRSNGELQEFAFVASHDLQEPLRKITAFSERLRDRATGQLDEVGFDYLNRMHSAAIRMGALINSLLEYSRVATRAMPFEPVDLASMLLGIIADLEQRIRESHARIVVHTLPLVHGDPTQLRQLFQNLLANALKFHAPGTPPCIHVRSDSCNGRYEISVSDNGIGFDLAYADKIFRPFQRLHGRSEYEGSGMGLAICRKIAQRHGAAIEVASAPGQGATFTVSLPAVTEERTEPCPPLPSESSSPKTMTMTTC